MMATSFGTEIIRSEIEMYKNGQKVKAKLGVVISDCFRALLARIYSLKWVLMPALAHSKLLES